MDYKKYKKDILCIGLLIIISSVVIYFFIKSDSKIGNFYIHDVYIYLNNSLNYAGLGGSSKNPGLPPVIPVITSIFFSLGFVSDKIIIYVSSIYYILTAIGMYLILRLKYNELLSFTGAIILIFMPINLVWATKGMIDIPGLAMSIFALYFMALGLYKNPKYYYLAFPIIIIGFFTRFTVILNLPVMLMLILFTGNPINYISQHLGKLIKGFLSGGITLGIILILYKIYHISPFFLSQYKTISATSNPGASSAAATNTVALTTNNIFYYINNIPLYMGTYKWIPFSLKPGRFAFEKMVWLGNHPTFISYIYLLIILMGLIVLIWKLCEKQNKDKILKDKNKYFYSKVLLFIVPLIIYFVSFTHVSLYMSIALISISILFLFRLIRKSDLKYLAIDFMFIYWLAVNLTFYSFNIIKTDRYGITFTPVLAYFVIWGLYLIYGKLKEYLPNNSKGKSEKKFQISSKTLNTLKVLFPIFLIISTLGVTSYCYMTTSPHTFDNLQPNNILTAYNDQKEVTDWIIQTDPDYKNKVIYATNWIEIAFNLKMDVNQTFGLSNNTNFTLTLLQNNATYYITEGENPNIDTNYYNIAKEKNGFIVYKRV